VFLVLVVEQTVNMPIADAYADLKGHFEEKGCKVISETPPSSLVVKQGSLWGVLPKSAKKVVTCSLSQTGTETKISCNSRLSKDWVNLTIIGTALSVALVGFCLWMSIDLTAFLETGRYSTWSWVASVGSYVDYDLGESFVSLTRMLAVFLSAIIAAEVVIVFYARSRIDTFAKEVLAA
jgi:hypothetical protein